VKLNHDLVQGALVNELRDSYHEVVMSVMVDIVSNIYVMCII